MLYFATNHGSNEISLRITLGNAAANTLCRFFKEKPSEETLKAAIPRAIGGCSDVKEFLGPHDYDVNFDSTKNAWTVTGNFPRDVIGLLKTPDDQDPHEDRVVAALKHISNISAECNDPRYRIEVHYN